MKARQKKAITEVDIYGLFREIRTVTVNFWDPGAGNGTGNATIVDSTTNKVDSTNIGRRLLYSEKQRADKPFVFDMHARHSDGSFKLPLDINGCVDGFKSVTGMTKVPMYEPLDSDPVTIEKFNLDLNTAGDNNTIDIDCEMLRFDYYFSSKKEYDEKVVSLFKYVKTGDSIFDRKVTFNFGGKKIGFSDSVRNLSEIFFIENYRSSLFNNDRNITSIILNSPSHIVARDVTSFYGLYGRNMIEWSNSAFEPLYGRIDINLSENLFKHCCNLMSLHSAFASISVSEIPERLLYYNVNLINITNLFEMSKIKSIPDNLLINSKLLETLEGSFAPRTEVMANFQKLFRNCINLKSIRGVFGTSGYDISDTDLQSMFDSCSKTISDISESNKIITYNEDNITKTVTIPDFWNKSKFPNVTASHLFSKFSSLPADKKALISNYSDIPKWYGGEKVSPRPDFADKVDYYFETVEDFRNRIDSIIAENNGDLINKTFGFSDDIVTMSHRYNGLLDYPSGMFDGKPIVSTPKAIFSNHITDMCYSFSGTEIKKISDTLFDNCPGIYSFESAFAGCSGVTIIPSGLFKNNTIAREFTNCFRSSGINSIPIGLFNNTSVTNVSGCFSRCTNLKNVPKSLFHDCNFLTKVSNCFCDCIGIISDLPDVWNYEKHKSIGIGHYGSKDYALKCENARNFLEVPENFGGGIRV